MLKKTLLSIIGTFFLFSSLYGQVVEFKIKRGSIIGSQEFAYDLINQYIKAKKIEGNNIDIKIKRQINYNISKNRKRGMVYEYRFDILYSPKNSKTFIHEVKKIDLILVITKVDKDLTIKVYKLDVSNRLK